MFSPWEDCFHGTWPSLSSPYYVDRAVAVSCITVMLGPTLQLGPRWSPGEGPRVTRHTSQCRVQGTSSERDGLSPSVTGLDWVNMLRGYVTIRSQVISKVKEFNSKSPLNFCHSISSLQSTIHIKVPEQENKSYMSDISRTKLNGGIVFNENQSYRSRLCHHGVYGNKNSSQSKSKFNNR